MDSAGHKTVSSNFGSSGRHQLAWQSDNYNLKSHRRCNNMSHSHV